MASPAASNGAPSIASASAAQTATPPTAARAPVLGATPTMMQLSLATPASQSLDTNTLLGTPPQQLLIAQGGEGAAAAASVMPSMMDPNQMYIMGRPGVAMPLNYMMQTFAPATGAPVMMASGATLAYTASGASMGSSTYSMLPGGGGLLNVSAARVAVYQTGGISEVSQLPALATISEDTLGSFSFASTTSKMAPQCFPGAPPSFSAAGSFISTGAALVHASASAPSANLPPPPQYSSIVKPPASGAARPIFDSHPTPVVRKGDAGRGYEAGVHYEGRVKRFNPIRGYGFVSATYKLIPLLKPRQLKETKAPGSISTSEKQGHTPDARPRDNTGSGANKEGKASEDAPLLLASDVHAAAALSAEINGDDVVYIKGVPHVRQPVTMGDVFVHYNCLQRSPGDVNMEANGGFVNLPAGSRVQFKVEVFVPAELMEKASDDKEAAAMLNNLGVPVEENPNLLSRAIATKKGWGYQAIDVLVLPPKGTLPAQLAPRNSATATEYAASGSVSSVSLSSFFAL
ncbi:hypothetical protein conserved [Leishmania donovani]|uniref:Uncharacterized protein n=3 Tax=Leishmania donovani species complex TaxID=38574 RepID=A4I6R1_LEIIN|nr:hypothetical protein, unknown function [Leishmania infantum JPCM5]CAC9519038.1 hypothetical_protein_-_conserved [Leishmania infantum]CAJ1991326.1 hypothetical protein conserved [Leishmania donovani]CAM70488.1 hypothetical protein, unknown function [Leishmania infantum JPCM5]SUZ44350.1 hypothetical_protein_-_conserved [Leishmania infantum]VDZ47172.1 hypothetical_protein_conserved [Leishmania donovani]|eukprot:XP_001467430.1 hypothetical protein, unknown function [Leishmania infantum JPCM5]